MIKAQQLESEISCIKLLSLNLFFMYQIRLCRLFLQGLNFEEDWKLLTILMGMNDICDYCKDKVCLSLFFYLSEPQAAAPVTFYPDNMAICQICTSMETAQFMARSRWNKNM